MTSPTPLLSDRNAYAMPALLRNLRERGATAIGSSTLDHWRECQLRWALGRVLPHRDGGIGFAEPAVPSMEVGVLVHAGLEAWFKGANDTEAQAALTARATDAKLAEEASGYLARYLWECGPAGPTPDAARFRVATDAEGPLVERELPVQLAPGYAMTTRVDLLAWSVREPGTLLVVDHKTASPRSLDDAMRGHAIDPQFSVLLLAAQQHVPQATSYELVANIIVKERTTRRPVRRWFPITRTPADVERHRRDAVRRLRAMDDALAVYFRVTDGGMDPLEASDIAFDGSPSGYTCARCPFYNACARRAYRDLALSALSPRFPTPTNSQ